MRGHRDEQWHGTDEKVAARATMEPRYVSAGPTFVFLHSTFHLIAPLRAGWRRLRLPRVRHRGRLRLAHAKGFLLCHDGQTVKQGVQHLHEVQQQGGAFLLCTSCPTRSLTLLFLSAPVREREMRRRRVPEQGHQGVVQVQAPEGPRSPTRASRCARRAPAPRCASTHLRFTPPYFPPLTLLVPFAAGTGRGRMRDVRQMRPELLVRSKKLVRADGTPAPLCQPPATTRSASRSRRSRRRPDPPPPSRPDRRPAAPPRHEHRTGHPPRSPRQDTPRSQPLG